jgi:O-antigen/teichoic acid export membrane protein
MIGSIKEILYAFLNKGHERTILVKKNIVVSFVIKGITILISLLLVPLTINYANSERNGIWLTLYSAIFWLNLFDIGLGNGMKNKLAEAKAMGNMELARKYISSTYAIMSLICIGIFSLFCLLHPFLNWNWVFEKLNIPPAYNQEILGLIWILIVSFCFLFVFNLLKFVVAADQRPAIGSFLDMVGQVVTLIGIFILSKTVEPSLVSLGLITGGAPVVVLIIASVILFNTQYKIWRPDLKSIDFQLAKSMINLGFKFFITAFAFLMVTQTLQFLIQGMTNPVEVTNFNTAFRLFSFVLNAIGIIIIPYWSSFTDAYAQNDFTWMQESISKLRKLFLFLLIFQSAVLVLSPFIYYIWVNYWMKEPGNILNISFFMSSSVCLYTCATCWLNICILPINGIGKIKLQIYSSMVEMVLILPIALWMGHHWGAPGIILAPVIVYIPRMIWAPVQLNKLIKNKATGIWNK